jgi:hypothetical protein
VHRDQGGYGEATKQAEALVVRRRLILEDASDTAGVLSSLASCHYSQDEYAAAAARGGAGEAVAAAAG